MKKILVLMAVIIFVACKNKAYELPAKKNIDDVILQAVHADYFFKIFPREDLPFNTKLEKIELVFSDSIFSHSSHKIRIDELLKIKIGNNKIFTSKDSAYICYQNRNLKTYSLDKTFHKDILIPEKAKPLFPVGEISIPIFSLDQKYAYIQVSHGGMGLGGGGIYMILQKTKNKWSVIKAETLWES